MWGVYDRTIVLQTLECKKMAHVAQCIVWGIKNEGRYSTGCGCGLKPLCYQSLNRINSKTFKFSTRTFPERQTLSNSLLRGVPCFHHWKATTAVINRAAFVHEWSKYQEFLRCQIWSCGQLWRFNVMEFYLLSVWYPNFGGMIQNYSHIFKRDLVRVVLVWCLMKTTLLYLWYTL